MLQTFIGDTLISEIIDRAESSAKKDKIFAYKTEVTDRCKRLCDRGKQLSVLTEYKYMVANLKKEFKL